ncbi:MAG: chemotaxis protein CheX [Schlesneria sp.]|nr:chemotaxis protein CheX [Schlesneria sp.]
MISSAPDDFPAIVAGAVQAAVELTFASIFGEPPASTQVDNQGTSFARVASVISFFGTQPWALTLVVPEQTAVAMALKFTGFEVTFDSADMGDVVGELTNVMAGEVVAQLARRSIQAQMSLPTVARGQDVELLRGKGAATQRLSYDSSQGQFWFELSTAQSVQRLCRTPGTAA